MTQENIKIINLTFRLEEVKTLHDLLVKLYNENKLNSEYGEEVPLNILNYIYAKLLIYDEMV